jgi:hypothetical protein
MSEERYSKFRSSYYNIAMSEASLEICSFLCMIAILYGIPVHFITTAQ